MESEIRTLLNQSFYRGISEYREGIDMVQSLPRWFNRPFHLIAFRELVNHSRNNSVPSSLFCPASGASGNLT